MTLTNQRKSNTGFFTFLFKWKYNCVSKWYFRARNLLAISLSTTSNLTGITYLPKHHHLVDSNTHDIQFRNASQQCYLPKNIFAQRPKFHYVKWVKFQNILRQDVIRFWRVIRFSLESIGCHLHIHPGNMVSLTWGRHTGLRNGELHSLMETKRAQRPWSHHYNPSLSAYSNKTSQQQTRTVMIRHIYGAQFSQWNASH